MGLAAAWLLLVGTAIQAVLAVRDVVLDIGGGSSFVRLHLEYTRAEDTYIRKFAAANSRDTIARAEAEYNAAVSKNKSDWEAAEKKARRRADYWAAGWIVLVAGALVNLLAAYSSAAIA